MTKINDKEKVKSTKISSPSKNNFESADEESEFAESIINTVREPLLVLDKDLRIIKASRSFYDFFKLSHEETIGTHIYDLGNHQWDIPKLRELLEKILPDKKTFDNYEVDHVFSTIGKRIMLLNARQIKRAFGKEKIILLAIEDITSRKRAEVSLSETNRLANEFLDILFNDAHAPIIIWSTSFVITHINHAFERLCGYEWSEVKDKKIDFLFPKDEIDSTLKLINNALQNDEMSDIIEVDILTKNKVIKTVLWNPANIIDKEGNHIVSTIAQDITGRKISEDKLIASEIRYRRLFESAKDGILILDAETGKIVDVNPFLIKLLNYPKEDFMDKNIWGLGFLKDIAANKDKFLELQQKEYVRYENLPLETSDGRKINVEFVSNVYSVNSYKVIQCNIRDITERKKIEKKAQDNENRFRAIIDQAPIAIALLDMQGRLIVSNLHLSRMVGYSNAELSKMKFTEFTFQEDVDKDLNQFTDLINGKISMYSMEKRYVHKNGNLVWVNLSVTILRDENGNGQEIIGMADDISERKLAEKTLIESEEKYRAMVTQSPDGMFIADLSGTFLSVNKAMCDNLKYTEKEFLSMKLIDIISPKYLLIHAKRIATVLKGEPTKGVAEYEVRGKDGILHAFEVLSSPYSKNNKKIGFQGIARDITEHKKIEANLSAAAELAKLGYWEYEVDTEQFIFNDQYYRLIHGSSTEKQGGNIMSAEEFAKRLVYPDDSSMVAKALLEAIESTDPDYKGKAETRVIHDNGDIAFVSVQFKPIKNSSGRTYKIYGINQDITERKEAEKVLIEAKEKAEEMSRLKLIFFANMSHELRTPLIGINGFSEILFESLKEPESKEMAGHIFESGQRLSETLNLILDITKSESDKTDFKLESVDLVSETEELINSFKEAARKKEIKLTTSFSSAIIYFNTDKRAYRTVMNSLINNAVKFTHEGEITVSILPKDNFIEIKVVDTGIGIAKKDQEMIFEEFRQASEGFQRNFEGTGLGLSITKKIVEKFGGSITVESELGKGSTFIVRLPITEDVGIKEKISKEIIIDKKVTEIVSVKPTALLVDDDAFVHAVLKKYLSEIIELDSKPDAKFAIKMLEKKKYDIIFMDINLKRGLDGIQATKEIRKMKGYESIPIIAITAYALDGDREEFIEAGCSHYLSKPFKKIDVLNLVGDILKNKYY